jgi:hypothetical protein
MKSMLVAVGLGLALAGAPGCEGGEESGVAEVGCEAPPAYADDTSPVVGAFIERMRRAGHPSEVIDPLVEQAKGSASSPEMEELRVQRSVRFLVDLLAVWTPAAGVPVEAWRSGLPEGELGPADASQAACRALVLLSEKRESLSASSWDAEWAEHVAGVHAAIHSEVPGVPQAWLPERGRLRGGLRSRAGHRQGGGGELGRGGLRCEPGADPRGPPSFHRGGAGDDRDPVISRLGHGNPGSHGDPAVATRVSTITLTR